MFNRYISPGAWAESLPSWQDYVDPEGAEIREREAEERYGELGPRQDDNSPEGRE